MTIQRETVDGVKGIREYCTFNGESCRGIFILMNIGEVSSLQSEGQRRQR